MEKALKTKTKQAQNKQKFPPKQQKKHPTLKNPQTINTKRMHNKQTTPQNKTRSSELWNNVSFCGVLGEKDLPSANQRQSEVLHSP